MQDEPDVPDLGRRMVRRASELSHAYEFAQGAATPAHVPEAALMSIVERVRLAEVAYPTARIDPAAIRVMTVSAGARGRDAIGKR